MSNISYPVTLTNGTVADANEVMQDFNAVANVVNGNLDSGNLNPGVVTGTGNFVLQSTPTLTTPIINSGTGSFTSLILPNGAPIASRGVGVNSGILEIHDGTASRKYLRNAAYRLATDGNFYDIGSGTDGAFVDVGPGTTITVDYAGIYLVSIGFSFGIITNSANAFYSRTYLQAYDATGAAEIAFIDQVNEAEVTMGQFRHAPTTMSINLTALYSFASAGVKTVKLRKRNITSTQISQRYITGYNSPIYYNIARICDA